MSLNNNPQGRSDFQLMGDFTHLKVHSIQKWTQTKPKLHVLNQVFSFT